jgi:hypothetical protein
MTHRLYTDLASWWPLVSPPEDYAEDAAHYARLLRSACERTPRTLVEFGSGGGHVAVHLKGSFRLTLVDPAPAMRALSRALNPECEHQDGDMRSVRLGQSFDLVLIHDAVAYMTTEADLRAALETAFVHTAPGGAALFAPDHTTETFRPSTGHGGIDARDRGVRYLEWTHAPLPGSTSCIVDYAFLLRTPDGAVRVEHDRHRVGLFDRGTWLRLLAETGFEAERKEWAPEEYAPQTFDLFLARRPRGADDGAGEADSPSTAP